MNILVTGCAGFIGSHAADIFLKRGYHVFGVDCLTYASSMKNLDKAMKSDNFSFFKEDICNTENIKQICADNKVEWIINFAAETHVDNSILSSDSFIHSNIVGVKSLLEVCKFLNIKIFHISTDEVYGSIKDGSFNERDRLNPTNPYSATKAAGEYLVLAHHNTFNVQYLIARPANNFGPRQHSEKLIPTIVRSICDNKKVPIYGSGLNVRDWLFVKKNVEMILEILENSSLNRTYNITSSNEMKNITIVKKILKILEKDFDDNVTFVRDRPGHDFRYSISNENLLLLGVDTSPDFENNLTETVRWLRNSFNEK